MQYDLRSLFLIVYVDTHIMKYILVIKEVRKLWKIIIDICIIG